MKISLFGVTGFTGANIARELVARGHDVTGVARKTVDVAVPDGVTLLAGDIHDATTVATVAQGADALVSAVRGLMPDGNLVMLVPQLLDEAASSGARLAIVGGASSLKTSEDGPRLIDGDFPAAFRAEAEAHIEVLEACVHRTSPADWFVLSPAADYGSHSPGERRGTYRLGDDVLVADDDGVSSIGGEDLAIAFVDELEHPAHHRTRFTIGY